MTTQSVCKRVARMTLVVLVAGLAGMVASPSVAQGADDGGFAQKMLQLVNQQRAAANVAPLQWSATLGSVAQDGRYDGCGFPVAGRATDMGTRNYFSHTILGCGTQGVSGILSALGVQTSGYAENIAWMSGTTDPLLAAERLTNDLMASSGHRANMLNAAYTHVGIGSWRTATGASWSGGGAALRNVFLTAQVFGRMSTTTTTTTTTTTPTTTPPTTRPPATTTTTTAPPPAPLPAAPTAVVATGGDESVQVVWGPAASGPAVDSYGAFVWDGTGYTGRYATVCATCRSATVSGLANGRAYYVTVYGHNAAGWGAAGFSGWVTVAAVPGSPTEVRPAPGNASVSASWRGPTNPGTSIDGYAMFVFDVDGYTNQYAWVCSTCNTATVAGLVNGRAYRVAVFAHNPNGWGSPAVSEWVVAGTPGPPGNVVATRGPASVGVAWTPAPNSGSAVGLYGLFAYDANGYTGVYATACGTCTTGTVTGLVSGRTYTIVVHAYNAVGWGAPASSSPVVPA